MSSFLPKIELDQLWSYENNFTLSKFKFRVIGISPTEAQFKVIESNNLGIRNIDSTLNKKINFFRQLVFSDGFTFLGYLKKECPTCKSKK